MDSYTPSSCVELPDRSQELFKTLKVYITSTKSYINVLLEKIGSDNTLGSI